MLDPYMGTGTVAVVARDHGRRYLGAEIDKDYHSVALRRISGLPDDSGCFPNLKTLRDYAEATNTPTSRYSFDMQVGSVASNRSQAKIFSESYHLEELERRLADEEDSFGDRIRGADIPEPLARKHLSDVATPSLFDDLATAAD